MTKQLAYFADPMCSWCWGFSPVISRIVAAFSYEVPVRLVLGGLSPGTDRVLNDETKATIREHWDHVHEATDQPFDYGFFERDGFVYDTQPACQAVVTARRLDVGQALPFLAHLHGAFYRDNRDVTDNDTLFDVARDFGFERDRFQAEYESLDAFGETRGDFLLSRQVGITGFPALLAGEGGRYAPLCTGYRPWEPLETAIEQWLDGKLEVKTGPATEPPA